MLSLLSASAMTSQVAVILPLNAIEICSMPSPVSSGRSSSRRTRTCKAKFVDDT